ncbi:MAG: glycosyltransferase, partial [Candidatus Binatia bacterium]
MPRRLRLLWVVPHLPRRGISAARERWWHLLDRLAPRHDLTLLALVDPEDVGKDAGLPPGISTVRQVAKQPAIPDDPLALLPHLARWQFADPRLAAAVAAEVAAVPYDLVQFEYQDLAHLIPATRCPTILTVHQLGFAAWGPAWRATGRGARRGLVALYRHLRDLDFELRAVEDVDHVITMTPEDATRLRRFRASLAVSVSPVGVDCREFSPAATEASSPQSDLLFVGNFDHAPNVDAVRFLVDAILPRVGRPLRLRLVGRRTPPEIRAVARATSIDVVGDVDDVRPHLARAAVVVAPVRFGTGMRGKVLEALAMARPVVTTSVGAEGLGATSGEHLL